MRLQSFKKLVAFIMTVMMFSVFPSWLEAQPPCHNGVCPAGYYCDNGHCVKLSLPCNCNKRPIPPECGQQCGWYTDPDNADNLISTTDGSIINFDLSLEEIENVSFKIYNVTGKLIRTIADAESIQENQFEWDKTDSAGESVSPGMYILKVDAGPGYAGTQKRFVVN